MSLAMIEQCAAIAHRNSQSVIVVTSKAGYEILNQCPFIDYLIVCDYSDLSAGLGSRLREYREITRFRAEKFSLSSKMLETEIFSQISEAMTIIH